MKRYFILVILGCFFTNLCYAGKPYIGAVAGGNGSFDLKKFQVDASWGYYLGVHLGYKFYHYFRLEEEYIYQHSGIHSFQHSGTHSFEIKKIKLHHVKGEIENWSLMTNLLFDVDCPFFISPYFGGGIGYTNVDGHWKGDKNLIKKNLFSHQEKQKFHKNGFAWQFIAGLKVLVCLGFETGLEYRYFKIENDMINHRIGLSLTKFF